MTDNMDPGLKNYDVAVIGGGAAGLSAALMLSRVRRKVVVLDAGAPRNAPAQGVHGLLGHDGIAPAELLARGRDEVRGYGGELVTGDVVTVSRTDAGFVVGLSDRREIYARRVLVTTGLVDELPDVVGLHERWGRDVLHCPYCHGWEVRDQAIGVLATGPMAVHQAQLFRQLSEDVIVFTHTTDLSQDQAEELTARQIQIVPGTVTALEIESDRLTGLRLGDGTVVARQALVVGSRMSARAGFLADLGLHPVEHPSGMGQHILADSTGRTEVDGVWVAGNVTDVSAQVGAAASAGAWAAGQINFDLVTEEVRQATAAVRDSIPVSAG